MMDREKKGLVLHNNISGNFPKHLAYMKAAKSATEKNIPEGGNVTAKQLLAALQDLRSDEELQKIQRYFKMEQGQYGSGDVFIGVRMGDVFALAKACIDMSLIEVERLLESDIHEARTAAVSIMDFQARSKKTTAEQRKALFDLYIRRHDRINNWDLVDRSAPYVVGGYLYDQPRDILYRLAQSGNMWERRTAIVSTYYFIRKGDTADTFRIAALLLHDTEDLIHKAAGGWIREAGRKDNAALRAFLEQHAAHMPRTMLRYALEHFDKTEQQRYLAYKQGKIAPMKKSGR